MKKYSNNGITLVALVITVIVLLILAGVAISSISGGEGLFSKTKEAADKYNNAAKNEAEAVNHLVSGEYIDGVDPEPIANGSFAKSKGVNTPDVTKLPVNTTKYVTWTGTGPYTEVLSDTVPTDWYDYNNSKWANIKTTSADGSVQAYWVWIPRFAYKLSESNVAKTTEIMFIKGNGITGPNGEECYYSTDTKISTGGTGLYKDATALAKGTSGEKPWIVHPAFTFGDKQLKGIWVAKYEASSSNPAAANGGDNNPALKVQVKPTVTSWRNITLLNVFNVCRKIQDIGGALGNQTENLETNTHLIKSVEWGAVALLSQSKYGNYDRTANSNVQVWNNPSNAYITGSTGGSKDAANVATGSVFAYNTANGIKASTTGNVYGIYDMAGGAWDVVAGVLSASHLGNPSESKYYDLYVNASTNMSNYNSSKIGDMVAELFPSSNITWNSDQANFPSSSNPVMYRGGGPLMSPGTLAGVFTYSPNTGGVGPNLGFRPALVINY